MGQGSLSFHEVLAAAQGPQTLPPAKVNLTLTWGAQLPGAVEVRSWQLERRSQMQRFRLLSPGWGEGLSNCSSVCLMFKTVTQGPTPCSLGGLWKDLRWPKYQTNLVWNPDLLLTSPVTLGKSLPLLIGKSGTIISTLHGYWDDKAHVKHHAHSTCSMEHGYDYHQKLS